MKLTQSNILIIIYTYIYTILMSNVNTSNNGSVVS